MAHDAEQAGHRAGNRRGAPLAALVLSMLIGCARDAQEVAIAPASQPAATTRPAYDTTAARPIPPRDAFERWALERGPDFRWVDRLVDPGTEPPAFDREPLPAAPEGARIAAGTKTLDDRDPFPEPPPLPPKAVTIRVGIARSTYRTREKEEVLSAVQPFIDLVQREVDVRGEPRLYDTPREIYFGLLDGREQMVISHVFDYLLVRGWLAEAEGNGAVPLAWARPAHARTTDLDRGFGGVPGTSIELVVASDSPCRTFGDLKGARLALAANYVNAPGAFLTRLLTDQGHPTDRPYFAKVTLRRYAKDAVIDVLKGKADAACVDQGTVGALDRFYGVGQRLRTVAVSPRYNVDVLYTSANNVATHRTEIELTQRQLTTLGKDPEGQEVLFFFDTEGWRNYADGDYAVAEEHFADFVRFVDETPADLKPLLDPKAAVDHQTYDRYGDE